MITMTKPRYIDKMLEGSIESKDAIEYYNKVSSIKNYREQVKAQLLKEKNTREITGKIALVFCYDPIILEEWLKLYPFEKALVIFPDIDFLFTMQHIHDFTELYTYESFRPMAFSSDAMLHNSIKANLQLMRIDIKGLMLYKYEAFGLKYNNITDILNVVNDIFEQRMLTINTSRVFGDVVIDNDITAMKKMFKYPNTDILYNLHKGKPIVCVAGGASLNDDLDYLAKIQDNIYIICASAVLKPLLAKGIKPDLVTVLDMQEQVDKYFEGVDEEITVCCESTVSKKIWDRNYKFIISPYALLNNSYYNSVLKEGGINLKPEMCISGSFNVAFMSIQLAHLMGASKIILLGQDLCYFNGKTHVDGSVFCEDAKLDGMKEINILYGRKAHISPAFEILKTFLEGKIHLLGLDIVNCSKGVDFENTGYMTLRTAYNRFLVGYSYKDIDYRLKTQPWLSKRVIKRNWGKLSERCSKALPMNDKYKARLIDTIGQKDGIVLEYVKKCYIGVGEHLETVEPYNDLLLNMIIDVANKYKELL